jgi:hypothetical protein
LEQKSKTPPSPKICLYGSQRVFGGGFQKLQKNHVFRGGKKYFVCNDQSTPKICNANPAFGWQKLSSESVRSVRTLRRKPWRSNASRSSMPTIGHVTPAFPPLLASSILLSNACISSLYR